MITPDLYENFALYLDKGTFINLLTIKDVVLSFDLWVCKFKYDDLPFFRGIMPINQKDWIQEYITLHKIKTMVLHRIKMYKEYVFFLNRPHDIIQYIYIVYEPTKNKSEYENLQSILGYFPMDHKITLTLPLHCTTTPHILMLIYLKAPNTYHLYHKPLVQLAQHKRHGFYRPELL